MNAITQRQGDPFGIYIHFPFCARRCPYCDFNVRVVQDIPHEAYRDAVLTELRARAPLFKDRSLVSVYFGGGTPGLWDPSCIHTILREILNLWPLANDPNDIPLDSGTLLNDAQALEITLEANPHSTPPETLRALRDAGINRLSLGVQSFNPTYLQRLGRAHTGEQGLQVLRNAHSAGFQRLSFDLLFGGPHHTLTDFRQDLHTASLQHCADHVSSYSLIIEENTPFAHLHKLDQLQPSDDDTVAHMLEECRDTLARAGIHQYEISNYARPGRFARHNSLYWVGAEYMGLGVGAHEMRIQDGVCIRRENASSRKLYMLDPASSLLGEEHVDPETHLAELFYLGLRTSFGTSLDGLRSKLPPSLVDTLHPHIDALQKRGLITTAPPDPTLPAYLAHPHERLVPTAKGFLFANQIALEVL